LRLGPVTELLAMDSAIREQGMSRAEFDWAPIGIFNDIESSKISVKIMRMGDESQIEQHVFIPREIEKSLKSSFNLSQNAAEIWNVCLLVPVGYFL
jgi:hypothetical protein